MRSPRVLPLALLLALVSCGGSSDPKALTDAGYDALANGDRKAAAASFEKALGAIAGDGSHAQFLRASMGWIEALAYVDPKKAQTEFLALAENQDLEANDYNAVAGRLADNQSYTEAARVLDAGLKRFSGNKGLEAVLDKVKLAAADDPALRSVLEGLGYL